MAADMVLTMESAFRNYSELLQDGHPHVASYPLISSPWPTWAIVTFYLLCVYYIFPAFMKNREPYTLKMPILIYNSILVFSNVYIFTQLARLGWLKNYSLLCAPVDYSLTKDSKQVADTIYFLYLLRFVELFETIMFILRKKYNQVNKLHVIHHFTVPPYGWYVAKYTPVGCGTFFPLLNTFVHIVMYSYYALSSLGPEVQKFLWWKKYITKLQLVQFVIATIYYSYFLVNRSCNCPLALILQSLGMAVLFLVMFTNFYIQTYKKANKSTGGQKPTQKKQVENGFSNQHENDFKNGTLHHRSNVQNIHRSE